MESKKQFLEKLKKRFEELKPITTKGFKTDKELDNYENENKKAFEEYYEVGEQIEQLEWELMTPKEREEKEKFLRFLELKGKGEPFDPEDIL